MTRRAGVSPCRRVIRKPPQLVAVRGGRATIGAPDRLFSIFEVIFNVKLVGEFQPRGSLCFDVSIDGFKCENDQGLEGNLLIMEVSKIVKFQGQKYEISILFESPPKAGIVFQCISTIL